MTRNRTLRRAFFDLYPLIINHIYLTRASVYLVHRHNAELVTVRMTKEVKVAPTDVDVATNVETVV